MEAVTETVLDQEPSSLEKDEERLLIVDDEEIIRRVLKDLAGRGGYHCDLASSGEEALWMLSKRSYSLMLCDMNMAGMSGIDLISRVMERYPDTAAIMVTGNDDMELANQAMEMGAYGYLIKPVNLSMLLINISNALRRRRLELESRKGKKILEFMVAERTRELVGAIKRLQAAGQQLAYAHEETVIRLLRVADFRDNETARHVQRMSSYCLLLAQKAELPPEKLEVIQMASAMHDIGKIGIPDHILLKNGKLTEEEFKVIQTHAEIGHRILQGSRAPLLAMAADIALYHHEKWDGSGYPKGLKGEAIPIEARICAISDVFDALTSRRVYKPGYSWYESINKMREGAGSHFDGRLLEIFLSNIDQVMTLRSKYSEKPL